MLGSRCWDLGSVGTLDITPWTFLGLSKSEEKVHFCVLPFIEPDLRFMHDGVCIYKSQKQPTMPPPTRPHRTDRLPHAMPKNRIRIS